MGRRRRAVSAVENTRLHHVIRPPGSDGAAAGLARSLAASPPALVTGGAGPLYVLARQLVEAGAAVPARAVWSGAGTLHDLQRQTVERAFAAPVYQRYGAWETGLIAQECPEGRSLHLLAENVIVEVVRPDGGPAAPGETGEVLVTTLCNHAMPMIRYRLGDLAALSAEPCSCGRGLPVLRSLVGRTNELLVTGDGAYVTPEDVGNHLMTAVAASVVEFQIEQHADLRVDVKVVQRDDPPPDPYRERIATALDGMLRVPGATRVERVDEIPLDRSGKLRHIVSHAGRRPGETP
jgi:phenylacetate-CoA ligase